MTLARVLLIEDDLFIRSTLSALLSQKGFIVVGAVESAEESLFLQKTQSPEVAILDLDLGPGPNGIDIAHALREVNPNIGIIILTTFSDPRLADSRNLQLPKGALYFTKSKMSDVSDLVTAILLVKYRPLANPKKSRTTKVELTETQIEILRLVAEGQTTASIAKSRNVTEKSVEAILARIHTTLNLEKSKTLNPRVQLTRAFFTLAGKNLPND